MDWIFGMIEDSRSKMNSRFLVQKTESVTLSGLLEEGYYGVGRS